MSGKIRRLRTDEGAGAEGGEEIGVGLRGLPDGVDLSVLQLDQTLADLQQLQHVGLPGVVETLNPFRLDGQRLRPRGGEIDEFSGVFPLDERRLHLGGGLGPQLLDDDGVAMVFGLALSDEL